MLVIEPYFTTVILFMNCLNNNKASPIFLRATRRKGIVQTGDTCQLPPKLGKTGKVRFLEDCPNLPRDHLPVPAPPDWNYGTHSIVCCPKNTNKNAICFPSDPWCSNSKNEPDQTLDLEPLKRIPTMADEDCKVLDGRPFFLENIRRNLSTCVSFDHCEKLLNQPNAPQTSIIECGFDSSTNKLKICCPKEFIKKQRKVVQKPRYPDRKGQARPCKDRHKHCRRWKDMGGCLLNQHVVTENFPVFSKDMFSFMELSCMKSCGWCGGRGCTDDHPNCHAWTKQGMCVHNPIFMAHTCRESCGLCGFLATTELEEQVVGSASFSNISRENFVCGLEKRKKPSFVNESPEPNVEVFSTSDDDICGATILTDKWCIGAAHCFDDFRSVGARRIQTVKIRTDADGVWEILDAKRVIKHPGYRYPFLYDDIALIMHGRRIVFDNEEYKDSPVCLDNNKNHEGEIGIGEAWRSGQRLYKQTNNGKAKHISNELCKEFLIYNVSTESYKEKIIKSQINVALPSGLAHGIMCAIGVYDEETKRFTGPCKGDSGGSLVIWDENQRKTMTGIVSGGIGCGLGYPGWYTKVASYVDWIECIMEKTIELNHEIDRIKQACEEVAIQEKRRKAV